MQMPDAYTVSLCLRVFRKNVQLTYPQEVCFYAALNHHIFGSNSVKPTYGITSKSIQCSLLNS